MAAKKTTVREPRARQIAETEPKFPYTTKPSSLRRLLKEIPQKPKPPKFDRQLLKSWGFTDANDHSVIRVLKSVGLLGAGNEPTELYSQYMHIDNGAVALAESIRRVYEPLFRVSHTPYQESNEKLQNLFNIHSGGGARALDQQIQTFKALCENTSFENPLKAQLQPLAKSAHTGLVSEVSLQSETQTPQVHINLHIHLPENRTSRDYERIIEDIGRYIFGRTSSGHHDE